MHVPTKRLSPAIRAALAVVSYGAPDIEVTATEKVSPCVGGGAGRKGFLILLDTHTGKYELHEGSWGGANPFNPTNPVDLDNGAYPLPPHGVAIKGTTGYPRTFATIYAHPEQFRAMLPTPAAEPLTEDEQQILNAHCGLTSAGRKDLWESSRIHPHTLAACIDSLVSRGLLQRNKAGAVSVTTAGKNLRTSTPGDGSSYQWQQRHRALWDANGYRHK